MMAMRKTLDERARRKALDAIFNRFDYNQKLYNKKKFTDRLLFYSILKIVYVKLIDIDWGQTMALLWYG